MTTHIYPNSLVTRITEAVRRRGTATLDDLAQDFPGQTRKQLHSALCNSRDRKLLRVKLRGSAKAGVQSVWEPGANKPPKKKRDALYPVATVFDLAYAEEWQGPWPPLAPGRSFTPLGEWNADSV